MFELGHSGDIDDEMEVLLLMVTRCAQHSVAGSWYGGKIFRVGVGEIKLDQALVRILPACPVRVPSS